MPDPLKFDITKIYTAWVPGDTLGMFGIHFNGVPGKSGGLGRTYRVYMVDDGVNPPNLVIERHMDHPFDATTFERKRWWEFWK